MSHRKLHSTTTTANTFPQNPQTSTTTFSQSSTSPPSTSSSNDVSPSIMITVLILAIAVILSASLYLLLRFIRRHRNHSSTASVLAHSLSSTSSKSSIREVSPIIHSLPLFTYDNLTAKNGGDCAVCLSKFEKNDVLRLLPICCHAFHAECIDTWLSANMTCPLCRSPIFLPENELNEKLSGSFRVEIGNVSNRPNTNDVTSGEIRRSYSLGTSFDYIISGEQDVVANDSFRRTSTADYYKEAEHAAALAAEVGTRGGGSWLKDYLSSSSRTASFRSSGRWFFTGSSRRSTVEVNRVNELIELEEASELGNEIGELFRWLSGA